MSESETSSDIKVKYQNANGDNLLEDKSKDKKQQSTDTDYYFGMIANPAKTQQQKSDSESSELNQLLNNTESSSSSRRSSSSKHSHKSSSSSSSSESERRKSSDSREKYDKITVSPKPSPNSQQQSAIPKFTSYASQNSLNQGSSNGPQSTAEIKPVEKRELTPQEIRLKKIEMIRKLCEIKAKGFQLSKEYDFNSSLEEMEYEYDLLRSFADKRNGVKIFKGGILQAVSVVEFLNDKYDPFDFHLSGWGDHLNVEIDSWEDVLEEIYEKYKGTGKKMAPEIKLLYLIIVSASAFHMTKTQASKLPGLDSVLTANPGLLSKIINPGKSESSQFMTPQELNIERQREELKKKEAESKNKMQHQMNQQMQQQMQQQQYISQLESQLKQQQQQLNQFHSEPQPANSKPPVSLPATIPANQLRPVALDVRAPSQVKDILSRLHSVQPTNIKAGATETQDETSSNNDRLVSEATVSESNPKKRAGRKPKSAGISIF
jgi:hypothetical protein